MDNINEIIQIIGKENIITKTINYEYETTTIKAHIINLEVLKHLFDIGVPYKTTNNQQIKIRVQDIE